MFNLLAILAAQPLPSEFRKDAATLPHFARELEHVYSKTYDKRWPELKMANGDVVPIDRSVPTGAETYTYYSFEGVGVAVFLNTYAGRDLPRVNMIGTKTTGNIESLGNSYGYTIQDIRNSQMTGRPLEPFLATTARQAHDQAWNTTGYFGRGDLNMLGFLNHPNITILDAAPTGTGSATEYSTKTPDLIIADVNALINSIPDTTNGVEKANRCAFPQAQYSLLASTRLTDSSETILSFLQKVHPEVEFLALQELAAAKSGGNLSVDAAIAWRQDEEHASLVIPQPFEQFPVQVDGLDFVVPCHSRFGGIKMQYPLSVARQDGI